MNWELINNKLSLTLSKDIYNLWIKPIKCVRFDDKVIEAIKDYAKEQEMPLEIAQAKAHKYATEIAPTFNAYIYFRFGYWLAKKVSRLIYRVRVGFYDNSEIKKIAKGSTVVLVMNHRSNMDYMLRDYHSTIDRDIIFIPV